MAIERGLGAGGDLPIPEGLESAVDVIEFPAQPGIMEMEDGSAIVGELMDDEPMATEDIPFDANLAEYVDESDLMSISSDLVGDIEEDMSTRQALGRYL